MSGPPKLNTSDLPFNQRNSPSTSQNRGMTKTLSSKQLAIVKAPPRPALGAIKPSSKLWTNYFPIKVNLQECWRYDIEVMLKANNEDGKVVNPTGVKLKRLVCEALKKLAPTDCYASDSKFVATLKRLNDLSCSVADDNEPSKLYIVRLSEPKKIDIRSILNLLQRMHENWSQSKSESTDSMAAYTEPLNVLDTLGLILSHTVRHNSKVTTIGRSRFFDTANRTDELNKFEKSIRIVKGYRQSVRPTNTSFLLNVNTANAVFIPEMSVEDFINTWFQNGSRDLVRYKALSARLIGVRIAYRAGGKTRFKTIQGLVERKIENDSIPVFPKEHFFALKKGKNDNMSAPLKAEFDKKVRSNGEYMISVKDYSRLQFGVELSDNIPLIDLGKRCHVGAKLCHINKWQLFKGDLRQDIASIGEVTVRTPQENKDWIKNAPSFMGLRATKLLKNFGVIVEDQLVEVDGRQLDAPIVRYRNKKNVFTQNGSWSLRGKAIQLYKSGGPMLEFFYVYFDINDTVKKYHEGKIRDGAVALRDQMYQDIGAIVYNREIIVPKPGPIKGKSIEDMLVRVKNTFESRSHDLNSPAIYLIVLPDDRTHANKIYGVIKKLGDVDCGFHTVSITQRKLTAQGGAKDIYANVALKFNLKAGGINHVVLSKNTTKDGLPFIGENDTMVVGYDVSHPTGVGFPNKESCKGSEGMEKKSDDKKENEDAPSFVGLVASVDKDLNNWPAVAWMNESRVEMLNPETLKEKLKSRLEVWKRIHAKPPGHIIVYRDGVSEGQYNLVLDGEVKAIKEACEAYGGKAPIKLLFIVTTKRHSTRFYAKDAQGKAQNPRNGLVVDNGITMSRNWDFFLQPHKCIKGTARPIHYTVLYDEFFRHRYGTDAANKLEQLTHDMSYSFGRATKAVSICPPVYYADLVCTRAKLHYEEHKRRPSRQAEAYAQAVVQGKVQAGTRRYDPLEIHQNVKDKMYYI